MRLLNSAFCFSFSAIIFAISACTRPARPPAPSALAEGRAVLPLLDGELVRWAYPPCALRVPRAGEVRTL